MIREHPTGKILLEAKVNTERLCEQKHLGSNSDERKLQRTEIDNSICIESHKDRNEEVEKYSLNQPWVFEGKYVKKICYLYVVNRRQLPIM